MNALLPLPSLPLTHQQKRAAYEAKRRANMLAWGIGRDAHVSARTKAEQAEAEAVVAPQAPVVHRQVIEAAPEYEECMSCQ